MVYSFGPFTLDVTSFCLLRSGELVPTQPQPLAVLSYLVCRPQSLVTKEELFQSVWRDVHVSDNALTRAVSQIRIALCDDPAQPAYIQTVARRGYRFIAPVSGAVPEPTITLRPHRWRETSSLDAYKLATIRVKEETKRDRRIGYEEEKALLDAALRPTTEQHKWSGASMHDRIIGALETCCRQGEMLRIQNRHVDWERHQIAIPGAHAKDSENRRVPFDPQGRLAPILKRRGKLGASAFVFGGPEGEYLDSFKTAWESLVLRANGHKAVRPKEGGRVDREKLRRIDLHWHDLRHEGACRLLADGVDIRTIQLMLGHADIKQTQRYLNITDEELRKAMTGMWERRRQLRAVGQ